jgi:hypothetical protein
MNLVKKSLVIICLIAFAISTTGISFQKHSCSMMGTTEVALYPELFGKLVSCCLTFHADSVTDTPWVGNIPCCKNEFKYSRISTFFNQTFRANNIIKIVYCLPGVQWLQTKLVEVSRVKVLTDYQPPPIILSGTKLLHFLQNLKIALPY